jgi:uncharacterized cupredoxin-like copper-binding protein
MFRIGFAVAAACILAASAVASASGGSSRSAVTPQTIAVGMSEFRFAVSPRIASKRLVVFAVKNNGTIGHDFRIAGKRTPLIAPGRRGTLRVTFTKAGRYPYLCTLPSHAQAGMKGVLVVR